MVTVVVLLVPSAVFPRLLEPAPAENVGATTVRGLISGRSSFMNPPVKGVESLSDGFFDSLYEAVSNFEGAGLSIDARNIAGLLIGLHSSLSFVATSVGFSDDLFSPANAMAENTTD